MKLIAPDLAQNDEFRQRFQLESKLAASIDHPHVIPIFDAGDDNGQLYVAMRYVEGTDLRELIAREGRLDVAQAVRMVAEVADALDAAHARGLVHRDVKPANVLLEPRGSGLHSYLTDFGLVKTIGGTDRAADAHRASGSERPTTQRPSRSWAARWTPARTSTRSAACSITWSRASRRSRATRTWPSCSRTCRTRRRASRRRGPTRRRGSTRSCETALAKDPAERYPTRG